MVIKKMKGKNSKSPLYNQGDSGDFSVNHKIHPINEFSNFSNYRQVRGLTGLNWYQILKKIFCLGDDDDDDGYDGEDDGANDVMIGDQNDDYYRHNSSNRHEASLVVQQNTTPNQVHSHDRQRDYDSFIMIHSQNESFLSIGVGVSV